LLILLTVPEAEISNGQRGKTNVRKKLKWREQTLMRDTVKDGVDSRGREDIGGY